MSKDIRILIPYIKYFFKTIQPKRIHFNCIFLSGLLLLLLPQIRSDEIFLKCVGKYEINRGALIKPDWETSYLTINLDGLISTIDDKEIKKEGRTLIRRNSYTITQRDNRNRVKNIYKINATHGTYSVESPQMNRTLIGTCHKGRG